MKPVHHKRKHTEEEEDKFKGVAQERDQLPHTTRAAPLTQKPFLNWNAADWQRMTEVDYLALVQTQFFPLKYLVSYHTKCKMETSDSDTFLKEFFLDNSRSPHLAWVLLVVTSGKYSDTEEILASARRNEPDVFANIVRFMSAWERIFPFNPNSISLPNFHRNIEALCPTLYATFTGLALIQHLRTAIHNRNISEEIFDQFERDDRYISIHILNSLQYYDPYVRMWLFLLIDKLLIDTRTLVHETLILVLSVNQNLCDDVFIKIKEYAEKKDKVIKLAPPNPSLPTDRLFIRLPPSTATFTMQIHGGRISRYVCIDGSYQYVHSDGHGECHFGESFIDVIPNWAERGDLTSRCNRCHDTFQMKALGPRTISILAAIHGPWLSSSVVFNPRASCCSTSAFDAALIVFGAANQQTLVNIFPGNMCLARTVENVLFDQHLALTGRNAFIRAYDIGCVDGICSETSINEVINFSSKYMSTAAGWKVQYKGDCKQCQRSLCWTKEHPCFVASALDGVIDIDLLRSTSWTCIVCGDVNQAVATQGRPPVVFYVDISADQTEDERHEYYALSSKYKVFAFVYLDGNNVNTVKASFQERYWCLYDGDHNCKSFDASFCKHVDFNLFQTGRAEILVGLVFDGNWEDDAFETFSCSETTMETTTAASTPSIFNRAPALYS